MPNLYTYNGRVVRVGGSIARGGGDFAPLSNGRLWVNINGPYDFLSEHMPLNILKNARPWFSDLVGAAEPREEGTALVATVMDADGYPTEIPAPLTYVETVMLSQQRPENGGELNGLYRFTYDGEGTYSILGSGVSGVTYSAGQAEFTLTLPATPGESTLTVVITALTPGNHMRNMKMYKVEHAALVAAGRLTRPNYPFNNVGCLRWMETQAINNDPYPRGAGQWPTPNTFSWAHRGISIEEICQAANETGVRPWICIHHAATDAYVTHIATVARDNLNPALTLYVEFTNEIWNFSFPGQTSYAIAQAQALWGVDPGTGDGYWLQWHGGRGAQVMDIFSSVFAGQTSRLVRVLGVATGVPGWEALQLDAPLWVGLGRPAPRLSYDAIAVGGYWGSELQQDPAIPAALLTQLNISQAAAEAYLRNRYLSPSTEGSAQGELFGEWDYFRGVCNTRGLDMLMYEGGTHFVLESSYSNHPQLQPFINDYNYSADIVEFYRLALNRWAIVGDSGYNQFVTYGYPGSAGSWGMLRYWGDDNARSDILLSYNVSGAGPPIGGKTRDVYAFLNSLHNHDAGLGNENTSTGNWVRRFAVAAPNGGHTYTLGWQFGFAAPGGWTDLPRSSQQEVAPNVYINDPGNPAWTGATNIEIVELVPDNFFGPLVAPDQPNVEGWVYTTRFLHHIDLWEANASNPNRIYAIHGGWPLLSGSYGTYASQTPEQRAAYIAHALGAYQTWLNDLTSLLQAARPSLRIVQYGINRASMLAWRDTAMNTIPTIDLFEDNAPHGRPTMYFVNAIANYIEIFDEKPPANFSIDPAWGVHTTVVNNYQAIVDYIWSALRE